MTSSPDAGAFARLRAAGFVCAAARLAAFLAVARLAARAYATKLSALPSRETPR